jgi:cytochrome c
MKSTIVTEVAATALILSSSVMAVEMPDLAKKNGCIGCHKIDKKLVGPAWQDVANKYKGDASAAEKLSAKITSGGKGVWGPAPMPANTKISDADKKALIEFILGLAK